MSQSHKVSIRGVSYTNSDGSYRQNYIKNLYIGEQAHLVAEPMHVNDRWAVAVFNTTGQQIGYLPSDARDASTILKGEPMMATVEHLTGAVNWFSRFFLRKKYIGVILLLKKGKVDWNRYNKLVEIVKPIDKAIKEAYEIEKSGMIQEAIDQYQIIINEIKTLNKNDKYASAHRSYVSPIDRLSFLLEKEKNMKRQKKLLNTLKMNMTLCDRIKQRKIA